jgi:UDP-N-acetylmuramoyl-L-alanyl-D-glutamate--2,6-diaminopimelate ligase
VTGVALTELVKGGHVDRVMGDPSVVVTGVRHDSRQVEVGDLFVAIPGDRRDGAGFAADAVSRGAVAVLAERELPDVAVPVAIAPDARRALGPVAMCVHGDPTSRLTVVGVTGTNGKTSTAWLLEAAVGAAGGTPAVLGTLGGRGPAGSRTGEFTTPEADEVMRFASDSLRAGATHLLMEVSSHGLALHRVNGVRFGVAAFTNLTQDHLDFHGDIDSYAAAKARLFTDLAPKAAVINVDDTFGSALLDRVTCPVWRCSRRGDPVAEVRALSWSEGRDGIHARVATPGGEVEIRSPLVGSHNLDNLLVALGCVLALGLDLPQAVAGLSQATGAPGRLERIAHPGDVAVFVDYAHTPDALLRVLAALRGVTPGRLVTVFGCGGDRDRTKRVPMGRAAGGGSDVCIVTSDNPRSEDPARILADIEPGLAGAGLERFDVAAITKARRGYAVVPDRREAIGLALGMACPGDTVLIAGKGHEDYQIIGTERRPFDDRVEARKAIDAVQAGKGKG